MIRLSTFILLVLILNILQSNIFVILSAEELKESGFLNTVQMEKTIDQALEYYNKSNSELIDKNLAQEYLKLSYNNFKVAELIIENRLLDFKTADLESQLLSLRTDKLRLQDEIQLNISLLKDKNYKDKIAEELFNKNSFDKLEEALTKINILENTDTTIYSSNIIYEARINYDLAKKHFEEGSYDESLIYSEKAIQLASEAQNIAISKNQIKQNLINDLKDIFGFTTNSNNTSIILSSKDLFLPLSSTIRFDLYPSLDKIADVLGKYEDLILQVESYDISNTSSDKLSLSKEQSKIIKSYLISKGLTKNITVNDSQSITDEYKTRGVNIILIY